LVGERVNGNSTRSASSLSAARWWTGLIEAAVKGPPYGGGGVNPRDPDVRVTVKRKKAYFRYKADRAVDEVSGLVRQAERPRTMSMTPVLAEALIRDDE
jgi:hypothetical protein